MQVFFPFLPSSTLSDTGEPNNWVGSILKMYAFIVPALRHLPLKDDTAVKVYSLIMHHSVSNAYILDFTSLCLFPSAIQ